MDRASAVIVLNDKETHVPLLALDGSLISSLRTFAVTLLAIDQFAPRPKTIGILGMGKLGRIHAKLLGDLYPSVEFIHCFSEHANFDDILDDYRIRKAEDVSALLSNSEVVVSLTTAREPYVTNAMIGEGARLIVNTSLMDFNLDVILGSQNIVVDDWMQNCNADKVFKVGVDSGLITSDMVTDLGTVIFGR